MLLSALSFLVVAQSSSEVPEGLMNNLVYKTSIIYIKQELVWTHKGKKLPGRLGADRTIILK